jgi:alpha-ketoglutarate-dependent taurine dioxygenase
MGIELPVRLETRPERLRIDWPDEVYGEYTALWLADNRPEDRHANGQRLIDVTDLPEALTIRHAQLDGDRVRVVFDGDWPPFERPLAWLRALLGPLSAQRPELDRHPWLYGARTDPHRDFAWADHAPFMAAAAQRGPWLRRLARDGIAFLRGVPCQEGAVLETGAAMGVVLHTNYGWLFDVRAVAAPENLAYTDVGLGLHTDNPYRDPVPGFQALHVLTAAPDGGDSLFADGLALAEHLRRTDPASFECLTCTPVTFHYRSEDADLCSQKPIIELAVDGTVQAIHYNNRSVAPLRLGAEACARFYAAYRAFARLLRDPQYAMRLRLAAGDMVVFDNRRTLHGRTAFASRRHPRHLQGCYVTRDSVLSEAARLP